MKTLILNGSPHKEGNTASLLKLFTERLRGEYIIVSAYDGGISPCTDCRYCQRHGKCCKKDGMEEVYGYTASCDNILIASPVYFSELTPPLLAVGSRFQAFYCARRFLGSEPVPKAKRGGILLTGGGDGEFFMAEKSAAILLKIMGAVGDFPLAYCGNTDNVNSEENREAVRRVLDLADSFMR